MAKILYGVCGIGAGHYLRSKILIEHLLKKNELFIIGELNIYNYLKKDFKNVHWVDGLELGFVGNRLSSLSTILKNIKKISKKNYDLLKRLKVKIDKFEPDLVISDLEAFSNYYGSDNKIKTINFDNEHFLTEGTFKFPGRLKMDYFKSKFIINFYKADKYLIPILPGQKLRKKSNAITIMPLIRENLRKKKSRNGNKVLVYTSIISHKGKLEVFKKFNEKFIIFGMYEDHSERNLTFRSFSDEGFEKELLDCKAIITSGGINLISEGLYLGKPLMILPIKNQFEQMLNALYVRDNKYGEMCEELDEESLKNFLNNLDKYKKIKFKPGNEELFKIIDSIIKEKK